MTNDNAAARRHHAGEHGTDGARRSLADLVINFQPVPVCLSLLHPEELDQHLDDLATWVAWLIDRYGIDHRAIPPCWQNHGALLEELSALYTAWLGAYSHAARADAPLDWHVSLDTARQRLSTWTTRAGCRPGQHRAPPAA